MTLLLKSEVENMKSIIEKITGNLTTNIQSILNLSSAAHVEVSTQAQIECNYADNYYGDQQWQLKGIE
mgnify:FL=1